MVCMKNIHFLMIRTFKHWLGDLSLVGRISFEWVLSVDSYSRKETFLFKSDHIFLKQM